MTSRSAVQIDQLTHRYGANVALNQVSLDVPERSLYGLLGPNGCGKTTLLQILATLITPTQGVARISGVDTQADPRHVRRQLGIVFQDTALDAELTLVENLHTHAALYGLSRDVTAARLDDLLPIFGLAGRERERVSTFSGGLIRRADLVRGLLHAPPLLLLDEPTTGLDPVARQVFWEMIDRLRRAEQTTLIVATHMMDEADRCDHLAILDRGVVVTEGSPDQLKADLGEETLWIETENAADLVHRIQLHVGSDARLVGSRIQISSPNVHEMLGSLYEYYSDEIRSATVRRPTLEDVFMVHAGHRLEEPVQQHTADVHS